MTSVVSGDGDGAGTQSPAEVSLPAPRICDYFAVIGCSDVISPLQQARQSKEERAAFKANLQTNKAFAAVIDRFPFADHRNAEFPHDLPLFAMPDGFNVQSVPLTIPNSTSGANTPTTDWATLVEQFTFILTENDGSRVYGAALRWYYEISDTAPELKDLIAAAAAPVLNRRQSVQGGDITPPDTTTLVSAPTHRRIGSASSLSRSRHYAPKVIVLTSHYPFFVQLQAFLFHLYQYSAGNGINNGKLRASPVPLERILTGFIYETPLPPPGQLVIQFNPFPTMELVFYRPPPNKLPMRHFSFKLLFQCVSPENVIHLFTAALTEKRILFVGSNLGKLAPLSECLSALLFPLTWPHIYIPLLPQPLSEFVNAPMPYLMGVDRQCAPDPAILDQVIVVDADNNVCNWCTAQGVQNIALANANTPLPPKRLDALQKGLRRAFAGLELNQLLKPNSTLNDDEVAGVFFQFFVKVFATYRDAIVAPSEFVVEKFDKSKFLATNTENAGPFLVELLDSQMFATFIDDRYESHHRSNNLEVLLFDDSIEADNNRPAPFISDTSQEHQPGKRFVAPAPNHTDIPPHFTVPTTYRQIPILDPSLVLPPRSVPVFSTDTASVTSGHSAMSALSMKFFNEKRMFSLHFHSLRLRSSTGDTAFRSVSEWMKQQQSAEEVYVRERERIRIESLESETVKTGTSVDRVWSTLKQSLSADSEFDTDMFAVGREELAVPLYVTLGACEHQLKLLFTEANSLESKCSRSKTAFEKNRTIAAAISMRYEKLKLSLMQSRDAAADMSSRDYLLSQSPLISQNDIPRVISACNESEDAALTEDEANAMWQASVEDYEERMPQIIEGIRSINEERIGSVKNSLSRWLAARQSALEQSLANVNAVMSQVFDMDPAKDIQSFSGGIADFWSVNKDERVDGGSEKRRLKPIATTAENSRKNAATTAAQSRNSAKSDGQMNSQVQQPQPPLHPTSATEPPAPVGSLLTVTAANKGGGSDSSNGAGEDALVGNGTMTN